MTKMKNSSKIKCLWDEESIEKKAEWFAGLSPEERLKILNDFYEFIISVNPDIIKFKDAQQTERGIQILKRE